MVMFLHSCFDCCINKTRRACGLAFHVLVSWGPCVGIAGRCLAPLPGIPLIGNAHQMKYFSKRLRMSPDMRPDPLLPSGMTCCAYQKVLKCFETVPGASWIDPGSTLKKCSSNHPIGCWKWHLLDLRASPSGLWASHRSPSNAKQISWAGNILPLFSRIFQKQSAWFSRWWFPPPERWPRFDGMWKVEQKTRNIFQSRMTRTEKWWRSV